MDEVEKVKERKDLLPSDFRLCPGSSLRELRSFPNFRNFFFSLIPFFPSFFLNSSFSFQISCPRATSSREFLRTEILIREGNLESSSP